VLPRPPLTLVGILCNVGQLTVYVFAAEWLRMMCL